MSTWVAALLLAAGLALVLYFAEKLVEGAAGTARGFGVTALIAPMELQRPPLAVLALPDRAWGRGGPPRPVPGFPGRLLVPQELTPFVLAASGCLPLRLLYNENAQVHREP